MENNSQIRRCPWCGSDPLYRAYHDTEWGKEVHDDTILFEFIVLESAQAGLSWLTVLRKRENYRKSFAGFDPGKIARFGEKEKARLLQNTGIIRNRAKIEAAIGNAKAFLKIQQEYGSFRSYLYNFLPNNKPIINDVKSSTEVPSKTPLSESIAKDLGKKGFKFFGPVTCYAFMQAVGMVNDHESDCHFRFR